MKFFHYKVGSNNLSTPLLLRVVAVVVVVVVEVGVVVVVVVIVVAAVAVTVAVAVVATAVATAVVVARCRWGRAALGGMHREVPPVEPPSLKL